MEKLIIGETERTPSVYLDKEEGRFEIQGKSLCDDPAEYYQPVISWFKSYAKSPNDHTEIVFKFDYLNTESSKVILDILLALQNVEETRVAWCFNEEDEDMEEIGEEIAELVTIPFEFRHE
ncbi:MAG: DUF1987 domain-containing protein [Cyclobacteriaceae bacterium]|nr:DUF1987 domain-containing protein [Cyclobacteriaceae bacterium]